MSESNKRKIIVKVDSDLRDLIPNFVANRHRDLSLMHAHLKAGEFDALRVLGHRLKGNAGGYGFDHLGALGAEIENAAKGSDDRKIATALDGIADYLSRIEIQFQDVA